MWHKNQKTQLGPGEVLKGVGKEMSGWVVEGPLHQNPLASLWGSCGLWLCPWLALHPMAGIQPPQGSPALHCCSETQKTCLLLWGLGAPPFCRGLSGLIFPTSGTPAIYSWFRNSPLFLFVPHSGSSPLHLGFLKCRSPAGCWAEPDERPQTCFGLWRGNLTWTLGGG